MVELFKNKADNSPLEDLVGKKAIDQCRSMKEIINRHSGPDWLVDLVFIEGVLFYRFLVVDFPLFG